ncbi:MAG TPA: hypothetical protein VKY65_16110 [Alphaproteobacteria bacterium]|nr:hypothetical protein [Alphaproteobacteria bacterium]
MRLATLRHVSVLSLLAVLGGCALPHVMPDDVAGEFAAAHAAKAPPSEQAARQAAVAYLARDWQIPAGATYQFDPLVATAVVDNGIAAPKRQVHAAGWFLCGTVTTGTGTPSMSAARPFYVQFDPAAPATVRRGAVESAAYDYDSVGSLCREIYGLAYLRQYEP